MPQVKLTVIDGNDKRPIAFAPVFLGGLQSSTNAQGIATINVPQNGTYKLIIKDRQYFPINVQLQIPPNTHTIEMMKAQFG